MIGSLTCQLRPLDASDYEVRRWKEGVMSGATTAHLFTGSFPMREEDVREMWEKERKAGDVLFGIWYPMNDQDQWEFIGTCGLYSHRPIYRSFEARFLIFDGKLVGKGIGKSAVRMLTDYAMERLNAHRVWLGVSSDNLRAYKCYLDCGYKVEGTLRDELFYYGKYHDAIRMSVLETDK